ncbi:hypothetical protein A7T38_06360 [Salmonella enterica subsp. enterica serovar Bareilly]|nr:hypothetical protein EC06_07690 [Salmonella enterica subsp. enterica serovar Bareilly str. CFSAN000754]OCI45351.1 hypothetical protein BBC46_02755 [Salmonella enterica]OHG58879.1 hypothetical protein A7S81_06355 [Salmonella enterica subsp. enterica serovar Bareilly]OHK76173.1 hypothetical protein A7S82_06360 [Salmonella enterica subsp. enterica serovar Bareilly]OHK89074.1 hypothetical protein A7S85_05930 [Salmonella enterica subsp. enterica serovar Bareilly]
MKTILLSEAGRRAGLFATAVKVTANDSVVLYHRIMISLIRFYTEFDRLSTAMPNAKLEPNQL